MELKVCFYLSENTLHSSRKRFFRNLYYSSKYNIKLVLPINLKNLNNTDIGKNVLNSFTQKNLIYYNRENKYNILNSFDIIFLVENLHCINYDIVKNTTNICFITHGITQIYNNNKGTYKKLFSGWDTHLKRNNVYIATMCNQLENIFKNYFKIPEHRIIKINSLPQIIINDKFSNETDIFKDSIVIFQTHLLNLEEIILTVKKYYPNKQIIVKKKNQSCKTISINFQKKHNVLVYSDTYPANFFKAYRLIMINGGTSLIEALKYNKKILIHFLNKDSYLYENYPIKLDKMLISYNIQELELNLSKSDNEEYYNNEYDEDIEKIFQLHIGSNTFSDFNQDFDTIIKTLNTKQLLNKNEQIKKPIIFNKNTNNALLRLIKPK